MSVFRADDFDDHEQVTFFADPDAGLRAIVAIHSTAPFGISGGGCRMWPYASESEALRDALRLSKAMSYKLALCDMPAGGAKCVVIGGPAHKTEPLLRALGKCVERLGGRYIIAEDVGTNEADMRVVARETKYVVGQHTDTGPATAWGAFLALQMVVRRRLGRSDLAGLRVAVQGLGGVGARLATHLARAGARLVVADIDDALARRVQGELGAEVVPPASILSQDVDVLAPCALGAVLGDSTIPKLRCKIVCGAANNQLAEERHADALAARGITFAPDFVVNAGGVLAASQEGRTLGGGRETSDAGTYDETVAFADAQRVAEILERAFELAESEQITPHAAAVRMAKMKIRKARSDRA